MNAWHDRFQEITESDEAYYARVAAMLLAAEAACSAAEADAARLAHAAGVTLDLTTREWPELRVALTLHNERIAKL